jgi:hypothetical protein
MRFSGVSKGLRENMKTLKKIEKYFTPDDYIAYVIYRLPHFLGPAVAQAVSRRIPTAVARVRAQVRSCGICVDKAALGQVSFDTSVFLAIHSTNCSTVIIIHHPGLLQLAKQ